MGRGLDIGPQGALAYGSINPSHNIVSRRGWGHFNSV